MCDINKFIFILKYTYNKIPYENLHPWIYGLESYQLRLLPPPLSHNTSNPGMSNLFEKWAAWDI